MPTKILKEIAEFFGKKLDTITESLRLISEKELPTPPEIPPFPEVRFPDIQKVSLEGIEVITLKGDRGDDAPPPTDEHLLALIAPLIPEPVKGADGVTPTKTELQALIKPLIPKPIPGRDSTKPGPRGLPGKNGVGKPGKDGSPDTGQEIIGKINTDKSSDVIRKEKVEGLADIESMARTADANSRQRGYGGDFVTEGRNIDITTTAGVKTIRLDIPVQTTSPTSPVTNMLWIDNS